MAMKMNWATPASQNRSYQSVIHRQAPTNARNPMTPRNAQNSRRGQWCARPSIVASQAKTLIVALFLLALPSFAGAQGTIIPFVPQYFTSTTGDPCSGCLLYTYAAGTTTPQATYYDKDLDVTHQNANPVVINSGGWPSTGYIYLSATSYKFLLTTSAGVTVWTRDNQTAIPTTSGNTDITGTAGEALAAGDLAYLSDGSGSLTAGRWYKADADLAYASIHPVLGFVPTAIASAATGTFRRAGTVTNLAGLTASSTYFVSGTAGGVTATAPANARKVGQALSTTSLAIDMGDGWWLDAGAALGVANGRLTATTGTPVTSGDVSAATSIFYTPYIGNRIALFDGSKWKAYSFSEITISVSTCTASKPYDVFLYDNAGVVAGEILVWTNGTTRATAIVRQDGVYVKSGATTRRYMGSFYCNSSGGQTDDTVLKRYLWNDYNRVERSMLVTDSTDTWTYTTATWRQARASTANQVEFIVGVAEVAVTVDVLGQASNDNASRQASVGIGLDSTSALATGCMNHYSSMNAVNQIAPFRASLRTSPVVGFHFLAWLEYSQSGVGTTTWRGDDGSPTINQSGLWASIQG